MKAQSLHAHLLRIGNHMMIANGVSENVLKTLTHSLLPEYRRYHSCASMHAADRAIVTATTSGRWKKRISRGRRASGERRP